MWANYAVFSTLNINMSAIGIKPLASQGLVGVLCSPFAHGSLKHIISNSISFFVLATLVFYFYRLVAYRIFILNWLISGLLLWIGGRNSIHIGASGIVYGLAFFLIFSGVFRKSRQLGAISLIVVFLYGGMFWGMFPQNGNISWDGHLFGAISGLSLAWYYSKTPIDYAAGEDHSSVTVTCDDYDSYEYEYIEEEI